MRNNITFETVSVGMGGQSTFRRLKDPLNKRSMRESQSEVRKISIDNYKSFDREYNKKEHHIENSTMKVIKDNHGYTPLNNMSDKPTEIRSVFADREKIDSASKAIEQKYNIPTVLTKKLLENRK